MVGDDGEVVFGGVDDAKRRDSGGELFGDFLGGEIEDGEGVVDGKGDEEGFVGFLPGEATGEGVAFVVGAGEGEFFSFGRGSWVLDVVFDEFVFGSGDVSFGAFSVGDDSSEGGSAGDGR